MVIGIIVDSSLAPMVRSAWAISDRVMLLNIKSTYQGICIIQCYAPTNDKVDSEIEIFFENIEATVRKTKHNDNETVFMQKFHAEISMQKWGVRSQGPLVFVVMTIGTRGYRLIELCHLVMHLVRQQHVVMQYNPQEIRKQEMDL